MRKSIISIIWSMVSFNNYLACAGMILFLASCKEQHPGRSPEGSIPEVNGFKSFYQSFHQDSLYQLSHIRFPIEGQPDQSDTIAYTQTFYWQRDQWVMHHLFNAADTSFERTFRLADSSLIIEVIRHRLSPLSMERRWSRNDTAWELIYYSPLRTPVKIEIN